MSKVNLTALTDMFNIFNSIDKSKSGKISVSQLSTYLKQINKGMQIEDVKSMLGLLDSNSDGKFNLQQFTTFRYVIDNAKPEEMSSILFHASDTIVAKQIATKELKVILDRLNIAAVEETEKTEVAKNNKSTKTVNDQVKDKIVAIVADKSEITQDESAEE
ncbi:EF_hand domain-containing protein [Hexamita inflata]|uniref:EF hand domain-containing protein n=1 Tax=Hexamita inflata TaxID=28002 RepID=A0AA86NRP7_9EUKA|nr:EF hand domain-containing protein [Hexamita inflata]